jgi:hypothetical protein
MNTLKTAGAAMDSADALKELIARQAVEIEKLRKNSARYEWVRRNTSGHRSDDGYQYFGFPTGIGLPPIGNIMKGAVCQHLDAAIDAAIQKETP